MSNFREWCLRAALVAGSFAVSFLVVEVGLRVTSLEKPWTTQNFTVDPVNVHRSSVWIQYDPVVGYVNRPEYEGFSRNPPHRFTFGKLGVRLHKAHPRDTAFPAIPTHGVLAVGDSFTVGAEVFDEDTWPARLEALLGIPVVNAGAGGYGIDQAILRAEQLLDVAQPIAIIVAFIPNCVGRNEYSVHSSGLVKPYFDVTEGRLELKNVPVPSYQPSVQHIGAVRAALGHSYALYWAADRLGLRHRWLIFEVENRAMHKKGADVTCLLWRRLAERTAGRQIALIALAQYAGIQVTGDDNSRDYFQVERILKCAQDAGFAVVDSYPELRRVLTTQPASFWPLWMKQLNDVERHSGHMSPLGNQLTAELLNSRIRKDLPALLAARRQ